MRYAFFSDLHASEEGLKRLSEHDEFLSTDQKVCLGDIINAHQPESAKEYYDKVEAISDIIVSGNHEAFLAGKCDADIFSPKIRSSLVESKERLQESDPNLLDRLAKLPDTALIDGAWVTHASFDPDKPWTHVRYTEDVQKQAPFLKRDLSIIGHGHIPFIAWVEDGLWYYQRQIYNTVFNLKDDATYLLNAGSILGSREMRERERTFLIYDDTNKSIIFYNLETL